ncbi:hypothetical protein I2494_20015 [Budviciaceae bacterium BWR-B9]|uniref:Lipoprotein n=1 Tax=Limnobaculum allomyrinae TaxID=2791986 RepID=A0ABS1IW23_9GAMM|nr:MULTISPECIES: hypothetical protein [Limnobaculum]MBK5145958.1 hypothetical protein [Limnobaculum allomyrinae]MBV7693987.1 hypothetical protein [Limnobaculum sp. M2-1]
MKKKISLGFILLVLAGCGEKAMTAQDIVAQFKLAGVEIMDVKTPDRNPKSPIPNSYKEHISFSIPEVAPKGGQIFTCDKKEYCDAIYSYFDALKAFAGPYTYQSKNGLVVIQLNSGLTPETAEKLKAVIIK